MNNQGMDKRVGSLRIPPVIKFSLCYYPWLQIQQKTNEVKE